MSERPKLASFILPRNGIWMPECSWGGISQASITKKPSINNYPFIWPTKPNMPNFLISWIFTLLISLSQSVVSLVGADLRHQPQKQNTKGGDPSLSFFLVARQRKKSPLQNLYIQTPFEVVPKRPLLTLAAMFLLFYETARWHPQIKLFPRDAIHKFIPLAQAHTIKCIYGRERSLLSHLIWYSLFSVWGPRGTFIIPSVIALLLAEEKSCEEQRTSHQ